MADILNSDQTKQKPIRSCSCSFTSIAFSELTTTISQYSDCDGDSFVENCSCVSGSNNSGSDPEMDLPRMEKATNVTVMPSTNVVPIPVSSVPPPDPEPEPKYKILERTVVTGDCKPFEPRKPAPIYRMKCNPKQRGILFEGDFQKISTLRVHPLQKATWTVPSDPNNTPFYSVMFLRGERHAQNIPLLTDLPSLGDVKQTAISKPVVWDITQKADKIPPQTPTRLSRQSSRQPSRQARSCNNSVSFVDNAGHLLGNVNVNPSSIYRGHGPTPPLGHSTPLDHSIESRSNLTMRSSKSLFTMRDYYSRLAEKVATTASSDEESTEELTLEHNIRRSPSVFSSQTTDRTRKSKYKSRPHLSACDGDQNHWNQEILTMRKFLVENMQVHPYRSLSWTPSVRSSVKTTVYVDSSDASTPLSDDAEVDVEFTTTETATSSYIESQPVHNGRKPTAWTMLQRGLNYGLSSVANWLPFKKNSRANVRI